MYKPFLFRIAISALATAAFAQGLLPYTISLTKTSFTAFLIFGTAPVLILLVVRTGLHCCQRNRHCSKSKVLCYLLRPPLPLIRLRSRGKTYEGRLGNCAGR
jgi:hypothetical protein